MTADKSILTFAVASFLVTLTLAFTPLLGTVHTGDYLTAPNGALLCPLPSEGFSYKPVAGTGPSSWAEISPCCGGSRQSPRNLAVIHGVGKCVEQTTRLHYNSTGQIEGHVFNNGKDPTIHFSSDATAYLFGAPGTHGAYVLYNIHVHFNSLLGRGSEHAISGRFFDGEVHLVHYKAEYGSVQEAVLHPDGLVVVALFLEEVNDNRGNGEIISLIDSLANLKGIGEEHQIPHHVNLAQLLPTSQDYYTYDGSLTTPPCSESVRWIVVRNPVYIHTLELQILTNLESADGGLISDTSNDRPLQTGDTEIQRNFACSHADLTLG
ncbi:unnamed protein product [Lymnaea stagnalis]|uniref:Carbonic anhydrase n=1 Tax=Lymnaea stagnalis TaxID=6523 RepID=A0AAV2H296_LYMST